MQDYKQISQAWDVLSYYHNEVPETETLISAFHTSGHFHKPKRL